ncbi:unnamed protein product [Hydatigera taeniaeformis]|uniref:Uncharacterized protein n=1 Tax=Hydatigena taeniaeformis TaxID=6205 RepID=A0A0R3WYU7_HYDTA|nr:unnamed protein product [Hydatigera taeniaeformis]
MSHETCGHVNPSGSNCDDAGGGGVGCGGGGGGGGGRRLLLIPTAHSTSYSKLLHRTPQHHSNRKARKDANSHFDGDNAGGAGADACASGDARIGAE